MVGLSSPFHHKKTLVSLEQLQALSSGCTVQELADAQADLASLARTAQVYSFAC